VAFGFTTDVRHGTIAEKTHPSTAEARLLSYCLALVFFLDIGPFYIKAPAV
jgi:hypothetical protein